jgi:catechol 2,3-dioxygenase-like lactoylglutathione lyase family enzyme
MIDHVSIKVSDFARSRAFYEAALRPLGYKVVMEFPEVAGLGAGGMPDFWISKGDRTAPVHTAFVGDRKAVDAFYAAATGAGGVDNGAPGVRMEYHPHYYGAFVIDPDGNNVEVVCHTADGKLASAARAPEKKAAPRPKAKKAAKKPAAKKAAAKKPAKKAAKAKKRR